MALNLSVQGQTYTKPQITNGLHHRSISLQNSTTAFTKGLGNVRAGIPSYLYNLSVNSPPKRKINFEYGNILSDQMISKQRPQTGIRQSYTRPMSVASSRSGGGSINRSRSNLLRKKNNTQIQYLAAKSPSTVRPNTGVNKITGLLQKATTDNDRTNDTSGYALSLKDIATYDKGGIWAMKPYKVPKQPKWQNLGNNVRQEPKVNFMIEQALKKKAIPAPNHYIQCENWKETADKANHNFQKFLKAERITATQQILARRKLKEPGPGTYKPKSQERIHVLPQSAKAPQMQMIDAAVAKSKETPGMKYNIKENITRPRSACAYQFPPTRIKGHKCPDSRIVLANTKKSKTPCLGQYKNLEAEVNTQTRHRSFVFYKQAKKSFIDIAVKNKKGVPGMGKYTKYESGYEKLTLGPSSTLRKRT